MSAMVNWRASCIGWARPIMAVVILGLRPPRRPRARAAANPAWVRATPITNLGIVNYT
jgi:hypothetical protein